MTVDTEKMKRPAFAKPSSGPSGRVVHDDRGNAVWEWGQNRDPIIDEVQSTLSLATTGSHVPGTRHRADTNHSHSPYDKPLVKKPAPKRKRSLRELSNLIEQTKIWAKDTKI